MRRVGVLAVVALAALVPVNRARAADDPEAVGARMATHAETVGLRVLAKPIVRANGATCRAGGTLGKIQALFFDIADTEPGLDVTSVELTRAGDAELGKGILVEVEYTVELVERPDEVVAKRRWTLPVLLNALLGGTVASQNLTIMSAKIAGGNMTIDARSANPDASKAVVKQLDAAPGNLVTAATFEQRKVTEVVRDTANGFPQKAVTSFAFTLKATYDSAPVRLDVIKNRAYN
jgi:hypothetical protein